MAEIRIQRMKRELSLGLASKGRPAAKPASPFPQAKRNERRGKARQRLRGMPLFNHPRYPR